jgi:hypothetical protein
LLGVGTYLSIYTLECLAMKQFYRKVR